VESTAANEAHLLDLLSAECCQCWLSYVRASLRYSFALVGLQTQQSIATWSMPGHLQNLVIKKRRAQIPAKNVLGGAGFCAKRNLIRSASNG
jgi:hypothetical protein